MANTTIPEEQEDDVFPYTKVPLDSLSHFVNKYLEDSTDITAQKPVNAAPAKDTQCVAILIDGMGSESGDNGYFGNLVDRIPKETGFKVCMFSYRGIDNPRYTPRDTVCTKLDDLVKHLDDYVTYYSESKCIVLIGYSLGGLIASEWLYRHRREMQRHEVLDGELSQTVTNRGIDELILIASPVRMKTDRIEFNNHKAKYNDARKTLLGILAQYTAEPELLHTITPVTVLRCENDRLIPDCVITFQDRPKDSRRVEVPPIAGVIHGSIASNTETHDKTIPRLSARCAP